jgi:DNA-binding transcriptional LysR family regulator
MDLNRISVFVKVGEAGSFTAAAGALGLPKSSVSRTVAKLEDDLGVRLLHRTTRKLHFTEAGRRFYEQVRGALSGLEEAAAAAVDLDQKPRGTIRVTAPAEPVFVDLAARFHARHPDVRIDMHLTSRRVDLVEEGFDLAFRAGRLDDSTLISRKIGETEFGVFGSKPYLDRRGRPRSLQDLARHDCILFRASTGVMAWRLEGPRGLETVEVKGPLLIDDLACVRHAVGVGLGLALLPVPPPLFRGRDARLIRVLPAYAIRGAAMHIVWPSARFVPLRVALFRDFAAAEMKKLFGA